MKAALFEYLVKNNNYGQVIIAENEIPNIHYKDAKLIEFSGLKDKGKCGFLINPNWYGGIQMSVEFSYNKLWKLLIDKNMNKKDLRTITGLSTTSLAKLSKGESVNSSM